MRNKIVAGNWKMNMDVQEAEGLVNGILASFSTKEGCELVLVPPYVHLASVKESTKGSDVLMGAQNVHHEPSGAYTGEVSAKMLASLGLDYSLVGHSERREYFHESDEQLIQKVRALLSNGIAPIFCIGESLQQREIGKEEEIVAAQLAVLFELDAEDFSKLVIAYEPVWAIGTGKTASSEQAQAIHAFIRKQIQSQYGDDVANSTSILYGGSCKPDNALELFSCEDIDGGLIGGASLDADSFLKIYEAYRDELH